MTTRRLFIASIGNPGSAYKNTLHSAGHILISALQQRIGYPAFEKSRYLEKGLVSGDTGIHNFLLWQSPTLMNVSGGAVAKAYSKWKAELRTSTPGLDSASNPSTTLILLHDELEAAPGTLKIRVGGRQLSARGHNGIKSVLDALFPSKAPESTSPILGPEGKLVRIGVGIGRPSTRDKSDVSRYVLKQADARQIQTINGAVDELIGIIQRAGYGEV